MQKLADQVVAQDRRAIGRALNLVENRRADAFDKISGLLAILEERKAAVRTPRIGITGPPGVGKSSLVSCVARQFRQRGRRVGVLAVDPSSPRSGGALLGDRARIDDGGDDGIFVRSMASAGDLGGLSRAAMSAVQVLASSHDMVIVESVGVGQSETDIELVSDITVMVVQPASGDTLQFLKAGILEIPDIFVVNKVDLGEVAERAYQQLVSCIRAISSVSGSTEEPTIVRTSASTGVGIVDLVDGIEREFERYWANGQVEQRRIAGILTWCERGIIRRVGEFGIAALGGRASLIARMRELLGQGISSVEVVERLGRESLSAIRRG